MGSPAADHLEPWRDLRGKVVMVTGASSGLGREFCLDLARAGCRIVAAAPRRRSAQVPLRRDRRPRLRRRAPRPGRAAGEPWRRSSTSRPAGPPSRGPWGGLGMRSGVSMR
ncbi:hypothetical protein NL676_017050 [Syzygium grande]|nr:hypothetical protein NL676_017050 [Syzygium grande]